MRKLVRTKRDSFEIILCETLIEFLIKLNPGLRTFNISAQNLNIQPLNRSLMFLRFILTILILSRFTFVIAANESINDGVEISGEEPEEPDPKPNGFKKLKRDTDAVLKSYIDKLKNVTQQNILLP